MKFTVDSTYLNVLGEYDPAQIGRPPLIFLHGFTLSAKGWLPLFPLFKDQFQPLAIDILGHGDSAIPENEELYSFKFHAQLIHNLLAKLEMTKAHWVGYSLGGRLLLYYALTYPETVNSMILESTTAGIEDAGERATRRKKDSQLAQFIRRNSIEKFVERWTRHPIFESQNKLDSDKREFIKNIRLENSTIGLARNLRNMGRGSMPSLWNKLEEIKCPVLLLSGRQDPKHQEYHSDMHEHIPDSQNVSVSAAGHNIHFERPEKFVDITLQFLKQVQTKEIK